MKFVGPINNARVHYSLLTWSTIAAEAQKKKKKRLKTQTCMQTHTKSFQVTLFYIFVNKSYFYF